MPGPIGLIVLLATSFLLCELLRPRPARRPERLERQRIKRLDEPTWYQRWER